MGSRPPTPATTPLRNAPLSIPTPLSGLRPVRQYGSARSLTRMATARAPASSSARSQPDKMASVAVMSETERRLFVAPPASGDYDKIDLALLDPADPDERRLLILAEHPELHRAIQADRGEIHVDGEPMSPNLHIAMH